MRIMGASVATGRNRDTNGTTGSLAIANRAFRSAIYDADKHMANWTDVAVLVKACKFAIEFREFYSEKDFSKCDRLLELADQRLKELQSSAPSWTRATAFKSAGFNR